MSAGLLRKLIAVGNIFISFNVNLSAALIGPTLLDLISLTGAPWDRMGLIMMVRGFSTVLGNVLASALVSRSVASLLVVQLVAHLLVLAGQVLIPLCGSQVQLIVLFVFQGLGMGVGLNLSQVLTVVVQRKTAHAWLQALFFTTSGAGLLSPILSTPFLSEEAAKAQSMQSCAANITAAGAAASLDHNVDLRPPYWISAGLCGIAVVIFTVAALWSRAMSLKGTATVDDSGAEVQKVAPMIVTLAILLACFYMYIEGICMRFLYSFAIKSRLCMSVKAGGMVAAVFGLAALAMRFTTGILATYKPNVAQPMRLIVINHVCLSLALITILIGRDALAPTTWIFAVFSGFGISNLLPSLLAVVKSLRPSRRILTLLPFGASVGVTIGPFVTTYLMDDDVAGAGDGFYLTFCILVHVATLLFAGLAALLPGRHSPVTPGERDEEGVLPRRTKKISYSSEGGTIVVANRGLVNENFYEKK